MTLPLESLAKLCLLPELKFTHFGSDGLFLCEKSSEFEVCHRCAALSRSIYDHRWIRVKDAPLRDKYITLKILKRRFWCKPCRKPFTEPVPGILKGRRTTRYKAFFRLDSLGFKISRPLTWRMFKELLKVFDEVYSSWLYEERFKALEKELLHWVRSHNKRNKSLTEKEKAELEKEQQAVFDLVREINARRSSKKLANRIRQHLSSFKNLFVDTTSPSEASDTGKSP